MSCAAVVMGGSAGAIEVLERIFCHLPIDFKPPILVVEHLHWSDDGALARHLAQKSERRVIEPCDKSPIEAGCVYIAPANYHMLIERSGTISLSVDERVHWSRPSIDLLFKSAARVWRGDLVAVLLSGANADGVEGLVAIKAAGGHTLVQDPSTATSPSMPQAAIDAGVVDEQWPPAQIALRLATLSLKDSFNLEIVL